MLLYSFSVVKSQLAENNLKPPRDQFGGFFYVYAETVFDCSSMNFSSASRGYLIVLPSFMNLSLPC